MIIILTLGTYVHKDFLWITSQFHHGILEPPMKINLCHCHFVLMLLNILSSDHYRLEFPSTGCSPLAVAVDSVFPNSMEPGGLLSSASSYHC